MQSLARLSGENSKHEGFRTLDVVEQHIEGPTVKPFQKNINDTFRLLISKRMRKVLPAMIWSSLSLATFAGSFVTLMTDTMDDSMSQN